MAMAPCSPLATTQHGECPACISSQSLARKLSYLKALAGRTIWKRGVFHRIDSTFTFNNHCTMLKRKSQHVCSPIHSTSTPSTMRLPPSFPLLGSKTFCSPYDVQKHVSGHVMWNFLPPGLLSKMYSLPFHDVVPSRAKSPSRLLYGRDMSQAPIYRYSV
jgi:hypothetical protein